jgi:hypothetical protein
MSSNTSYMQKINYKQYCMHKNNEKIIKFLIDDIFWWNYVRNYQNNDHFNKQKIYGFISTNINTN